MTSQSIQDLNRLLGADEGAIGFIETLPAEAQTSVATAVRNTIEDERAALDEAIDQGLASLPGWLRGIAGGLLK